MQIICPNCQAEFDLDPPAAPFARDQDLVFRCTVCSTPIPLRLNESAIPEELEEEPDTDVVEAPPRVESFILLRQGGSTYRVENTAQLQRWIAERRIWPDDEVAIDGGDWQRVGDIEAYAVFFKLVEDAERVNERPAAPTTPPRSEPPGQPSPPKKPRLSVSAKSGLFARPAHLDVSSDAPEGQAVSAVVKPNDAPVAAWPEPVQVDDAAEPGGETPQTTVIEAAAIAEVEEIPDILQQDQTVDQDEPQDVVERFGEVVPEEAPSAFLAPDQPTMDMELEEDDFFSEEHPADTLSSGVGFGDEDDLLEWGQQRRKNMVMWWLMFFGALGGAAYLALDFLNSRDAQVQAPVEETPPAPDVDVEGVAEPATEQEAGSDSGGAMAAASADAAEAEAEAADSTRAGDTVEVDEVVVAPEPEEPKAAAPPPPKKPSVATEVSRGWAQIDRENWTKAREHFETALRLQPSNPDARFGMAYVNEQQGRVGEAVGQYCQLSRTASGEVKIEAEGRLRALAKDCP